MDIWLVGIMDSRLDGLMNGLGSMGGEVKC